MKIRMNLMEIKLREYFNIKWYKRFFLFTSSGTCLKSLIKILGKLRKLNLSDRIVSQRVNF